MVWVIAFGELFFGDLWCVVWGYGGMRTHFSLLNPRLAQRESASLTRKRSLVRSQYRALDPIWIL